MKHIYKQNKNEMNNAMNPIFCSLLPDALFKYKSCADSQVVIPGWTGLPDKRFNSTYLVPIMNFFAVCSINFYSLLI